MRQDSFIDALLPVGFGRNSRLESIDKVIDWEPNARWSPGCDRAGLAGRLTSRSPCSGRCCCGMETTLCRFRNALRQAGLGEALFQEVLRQLEAAGLVLKTGTLIDATLFRRAPAFAGTSGESDSRSSTTTAGRRSRHRR